MSAVIGVAVGDGIGRVVLDNPPLNILTRAVLAELRRGLATLASDAALRVLVLTAQGRHFSAGSDVAEHLPPLDAQLIPEFMDTIAALAAFPLPVIAAVRGQCLGGGFELVQAADLVVAGEGATVGQPEIRLGVVAPAACVLLPRKVPPGVAAQILYTGDAMTAREAERVGLVTRVVPDADIETAALELAGRIARHSAATLRIVKAALRGGMAPTALRQAGELYLRDVMGTADALEGLRSFIEKRRPAWSHR